MNQPFSNPFASNGPGFGGAPTPSVSSQPLAAAPAPNYAYQAPAHPSPVAVAPVTTPAPMETGAIRAPTPGGPAGWTAVGGSPVIVLQGDTADSLSRRYGVPLTAMLSANGLSSASQVHAGMHIVVPVYNARAVGAAPSHPAPVAVAEPVRKTAEVAEVSDGDHKKAHAKSRDADDGDEDKPAKKDKHVKIASRDDDEVKTKDRKSRKEEAEAAESKSGESKSAESKSAESKSSESKSKRAKKEEEAEASESKPRKSKDDTETKDKKSKTKEAEASEMKPAVEKKTAEAKPEKKAEVKTAEVKPAEMKAKVPPETTKIAETKPAPKVDGMPVAGVQGASSEPVKTAAEADASGGNPEFRWPARGRIIQGFKSGGNDGINISVPDGTSVRAAESGVVAYAGSELKGYGNLILIRHPNGFVTAYANNGEIGVKRGEQVKRGQVIAKSGESGNVSAPQLHFELRDKSGQPVDPTSYLAGI